MTYIDKNILSNAYPLMIRTQRGKRHTCYIQRVECSLYYKLGFDKYHYQNGELSKGSMGLLLSSRRNKPLGFIVLRNQTFRGCSNAMMVSRYVILPTFQRRGLSIKILEAVGAMLKKRGMRLYINTHLEAFGEALGRCGTFKSTTTDRIIRRNTSDGKYRKRQDGVAYRKMYNADEAEICYNQLFMPVKKLRAKQNKPIKQNNIVEWQSDTFTITIPSPIISGICQLCALFAYHLLQRDKIPDRNGGFILQYG